MPGWRKGEVCYLRKSPYSAGTVNHIAGSGHRERVITVVWRDGTSSTVGPHAISHTAPPAASEVRRSGRRCCCPRALPLSMHSS
jgi:hypothetical protein